MEIIEKLPKKGAKTLLNKKKEALKINMKSTILYILFSFISYLYRKHSTLNDDQKDIESSLLFTELTDQNKHQNMFPSSILFDYSIHEKIGQVFFH